MSSTQPARYATNAPGYRASTLAFVTSPDGSTLDYILKPTDSIVELDLGSFDVGPRIFFTTPVEDFPILIRDISDFAGPWELHSAVPGVLIEDPASPGTFHTSVTIGPANSGGTWVYDRPSNRWICLLAIPFPASGGGGSLNYSQFFAMMPGDNTVTIKVAPEPNHAVQFPQDGPSSGAAVRTGPATFRVPLAGTYRVAWQVATNEPGQLAVAIGDVLQPNTVVGRDTGTTQIIGDVLVTLGANAIVSIINPPGNSTALTIEPDSGGANAVSATLIIERVDVAGGGQGPAGPAFLTGAVSIENAAPLAAGGGPGSAANQITFASAPFVTPLSGKVLVQAVMQSEATATNAVQYTLIRDAGGVEVQLGPAVDAQAAANGTSAAHLSWVDTTAPAGSHTYAIRGSNGSSNAIAALADHVGVTVMGVT